MVAIVASSTVSPSSAVANDDPSFERDVAPILQRRCLECHGPNDSPNGPPKGKLSLSTWSAASLGGESGPAIVRGKPAESLLLEFVRHDADGKALMPKNREPLTPAEVATLERWIAAGTAWPENHVLRDRKFDGYRWWSLEPIVRPAVPEVAASADLPSANPVDRFIREKLQEKGLSPSREAAPAVLCRRLYYDLIGLPPTPEQIDAFVSAYRKGAENAYTALVDELLASPHYGERWARHWLDVVHFGETHGYDKDKPRENAWPYRDYVIRAFNEDRPYARFVEEQLAGDVLYPDTRDGNEALGFIAAGPWDLIGHAEVPETKTDGKIARHLDRDDMVTNTIQTFASLTVQCAQCHDHKFDPITQEDYYSLQAVFAAVDRTTRSYDVDPAVAKRRVELTSTIAAIGGRQQELEKEISRAAGDALPAIDREIAALSKSTAGSERKSEAYGYHSAISAQQDVVKWVQVDLGRSLALSAIALHPCRDNFNGIGDGFGFPLRYKVEISDDPNFKTGVVRPANYTEHDVPNPGILAQSAAAGGKSARYVRVTATKLAPRKNDFIFALAELTAIEADGKQATPQTGQAIHVTSLDTIEASPRWRRTNLVDGYYPGLEVVDPGKLAALTKRRAAIAAEAATPQQRLEATDLARRKASAEADLRKLRPQQSCYVAAVHTGTGAFRGTGPDGGRPRPIFVLARGNVSSPGKEVRPGTISAVRDLPSRFDLSPDANEAERRAALARWLVDRRNPLTWRSIVNRIWQYHFGRGIVETPNDFGRNGARPSHPELLDWLAAEFRDGGVFVDAQSIKSLHRLIVTSHAYRQISGQAAGGRGQREPESLKIAQSIDAENRLLWRANRRRLDAEALRDSVLVLGGKLDRTMYGPSFRDFVIDKPQHSPHYEYHLHDPNDPKSHRRSVYRFIVRSQPQPFMTTFDCADPSMQVDRRNESLSPLQALTLLNSGLTVTMAEHFAARLEATTSGTTANRIARGFYEASGRAPTAAELDELTKFAERHGLAAACRVLLNLNEFMFID
ncbi:MAG: DUF1553 domain-containing protein [Planctomycetes bacterium]|nr:DUF1553 domain-containing protein [Planctomycetota bacterium]